MKKIILLTTILFINSTSYSSELLAKNKNCLSCHHQEIKIIGPSFNDIRQKYGKSPSLTTQEKLAYNILNGSKDNWGNVAMPANTQLNNIEAKELLQWIINPNNSK